MEETERDGSKLALFCATRCPDAARRSLIDDAVLPSKPKVSNVLWEVSYPGKHATVPLIFRDAQ
jgi:hypothetical protein